MNTYMVSGNLDVPHDEIRTALDAVLAENRRIRNAYALAELALEGITPEQFAERTGGADPSRLLADPKVAASVELLVGRADIQDAAMDAQLRRALRATVNVLAAQVDSPECSVNAAQGVGDTLMKVANLLDRRKESHQQQQPERRMFLFNGEASVTTPEGEVSIRVDSPKSALEVVRAMRCTTDNEAKTVLGLFRRGLLHGALTIGGW